MDQWNNHVDEEIRIPIKDFHNKTEWSPLGKNSWMEKPAVSIDATPCFVPLKTSTEWAIAHQDGSVSETYNIEDVARFDLGCAREVLKMYRVPEEYWPILMERTVETVASSWRILSE
jgi:hypothetical protein